MSRCVICGNAGCPSCNPSQRPESTAGDIFDSLLSESLGASPGANSRDSGAYAVWASSHLNYFRARSGSLPSDIGFRGCGFPHDGCYRLLDQFWLAWLHSRVERLQGAQKSEGRARLRDIITEAINAGCVPESLDNPANWPRIVPAGYEPPVAEFSSGFWPMAVDELSGLD